MLSVPEIVQLVNYWPWGMWELGSFHHLKAPTRGRGERGQVCGERGVIEEERDSLLELCWCTGYSHMEPHSLVLLGLLLTCGLVFGTQTHTRDTTQEFDSSEADIEREFFYTKRSKRAPAELPQDKCSYTFIVPQQKVTGAICVNSKEPEASLESRVNKQELELLNVELQKQKRQIETLQQLVEVDGGIVTEVKLLRKESRNMNSRVTQLYMQLLHEIIRKRDNALELAQMENKILNQTSEMQMLTSRYKDLEHKYLHLASLATNQSALISLLEEQCQTRPPHGRSLFLSRGNSLITNEIQSDQKSLSPLPTIPTGTQSNTTTNKPSGPYKDCLEALEDGQTNSGMYLVKPEGSNKLMQVWCDQRHDPGGWTVIQRRSDGSVNFFRNWETYKVSRLWQHRQRVLAGSGEHLLADKPGQLQAPGDPGGLVWEESFAEYASFRVENEADFYKLRIGRYHGNAGDSLTWHNGKQFTTLDRDHDTYTEGGWWYNSCAHSNLNGVWYRGGHYRSRYQDGVYWAEFRGGAYSLKKVTMMVRPNPNTFH
ncbi:hypothetical protein WMY93_004353 [Mugilogobius chulae]|uniref:Fibrinogen C-terminal domain-containing protein n=1 Tax=Mugilogobius chulae TaxID=88201 RepID=A0AAW0PNH1_9GOBI